MPLIHLVVDANIVLALLIRSGKTRELFFDDRIELYAPELLLQEVVRNRDMVLRKAAISERTFADFLSVLRARISVIPHEKFASRRTEAIIHSPDPKDTSYFALALHLECALWSNEKRLKRQHVLQVLSTQEVLALLDR